MHPRLYFTLVFLALFNLNSFSQWQPVGLDLLPDTQRVASIDVLNENVVWGVAYYDRTPAPVPSTLVPHVFRTIDGGEEWEVFPILEAQGRICQDIIVMNDSTAWITTNGLGADSLRGLFKTTNGGKSWEEKFDDPAGGGLLHFFDDSIGLAIHEQFMAYTFDAGENWQNFSPDVLPLGSMESIFYTAGNNALAVVGDSLWFGSTQGRVFRSVNRGFDWEIMPTPFAEEDIIISTAFRNAREGMIISYAKLNGNSIIFTDSTNVAVTFDGGDNWILADTLFDFKVSCVTSIPDVNPTFMGVTNGLATLTTDTAQTWQNFSYRPYNAVEFFNAELGWVGNSQTSVDNPAIMYKWEGVVSNTSTVSKNNLQVKIFPNPFSEEFRVALNVSDFEKLRKDDLSIEVYDMLGKKMLTQNINDAEVQVNFPSAANGVYFYLIRTEREILFSGKLLLNK